MKDIVLVSLKRCTVFFRTGQLHVAPKGDIILVNADEIHTGSSAVESGWRYRAIYPTPEMLAEVSQDFFEQGHGAPLVSASCNSGLGIISTTLFII